ncbi:MAG: VWA domain-containing protein [Acidobacteria bacterium]|nr:VWA domain-containing protein [Acidobacteriota bacterium]
MPGLLLLSGVLAAQAVEDAPATKFSVDVGLVNVAFSVRNRAGALIADLTRDDVEIREDGVPQQVKYFATERDTPLTVGIVIDFSPSQQGFEDENAYVALAFLKRILRDQDRVFVVAFGNRIRLISPPGNSLEALEGALRTMREKYDQAPRVGPKVEREGGSAVLDAIYWSAREHLATVGGRKALIMIGDGKENASKQPTSQVIESLQNADILFYGLDNGGQDLPGGRQLHNRMPLIAEETGGHAFELAKTPLREAFPAIEMELRALYSAGYVSTNTARDGRFRRIEVKLKDPNLRARARPGYYAK